MKCFCGSNNIKMRDGYFDCLDCGAGTNLHSSVLADGRELSTWFWQKHHERGERNGPAKALSDIRRNVSLQVNP